MAFIKEKNGRWYACWRDPKGRQRSKACGPGDKGKSLAERLAKRIEAELISGTYTIATEVTWKDFRAKYDDRCLDQLRGKSRDSALSALKNFERITRVKKMKQLDGETIPEYIQARRKERGKQPNSLVSPATVNRELRTIKAALRCAFDWGYITFMPKAKFLKVEQTDPEFISSKQFSKLYKHCSAASAVVGLPESVTAEEWWKGLLLFLFMTGWRIEQTSELSWEDVDLKNGQVFSPAENNKGCRDIRCALHPIVVEAITPLQQIGSETVFALGMADKTPLYKEFRKIQAEAKVLPERKEWFGFHDLRRGFATANAENLDLFELQQLMQHKSLETTRKYVNMAKRASKVNAKLNVPDLG